MDAPGFLTLNPHEAVTKRGAPTRLTLGWALAAEGVSGANARRRGAGFLTSQLSSRSLLASRPLPLALFVLIFVDEVDSPTSHFGEPRPTAPSAQRHAQDQPFPDCRIAREGSGLL